MVAFQKFLPKYRSSIPGLTILAEVMDLLTVEGDCKATNQNSFPLFFVVDHLQVNLGEKPNVQSVRFNQEVDISN